MLSRGVGHRPVLTPTKEDVVRMKCDICDEEFDTQQELAQHKAKMHAGMEPAQGEDAGRMDEGEEPDYKRAVNE